MSAPLGRSETPPGFQESGHRCQQSSREADPVRSTIVKPGDVISYLEMCSREGVSLQRGMNFGIGSGHSVLLMSLRPGAPYEDQISDDGRILEYEGHDQPTKAGGPDPKSLDQVLFTANGTPTQNGLFYRAAEAFRNGESPPEQVRVYEKVRQGIWVYTGHFLLVDAWFANTGDREVCKFGLRLVDSDVDEPSDETLDEEMSHTRIIPTQVKLEVWSRDKGKCVMCGSKENLHFDHIIPYSKGGSSATAANVQLLCAKHNLQKHDHIV